MPKKWKCMICGKEDCWSMVEQDRGPLMCLDCWELKKPEKEEERRDEE